MNPGTDVNGNEVGPVYSPFAFSAYGGYLAFTAYTNGTRRVFAANYAFSPIAIPIGDGVDPMISVDGRFVGFRTFPEGYIYVVDGIHPVTYLVSVNKFGNPSAAQNAVMSADGRFVAFESDANDLVDGIADNNGVADVYVRDLGRRVDRDAGLRTGITTLVSVNRAGTAAGAQGGQGPAINANGGFVAFSSMSSDLVAVDLNQAADGYGGDVFVRPTP